MRVGASGGLRKSNGQRGIIQHSVMVRPFLQRDEFKEIKSFSKLSLVAYLPAPAPCCKNNWAFTGEGVFLRSAALY